MTVGSTADGAHKPVWQALLEEPIRHCGVEGIFGCNAPHQLVLHTVSKPVIAAMMVCRRAASACKHGGYRACVRRREEEVERKSGRARG